MSSRIIVEVLQQYRSTGGTVVFSSHVMDTVERLCDEVAIVAAGSVVRAGAVREIRGAQQQRLEDVFIESVGAMTATSSDTLEWLGSST